MTDYINDDCFNYLSRLEDKSISLIVTDPPYGLDIARRGSLSIRGASSKSHTFTKSNWDTFIPTSEYFNEIIRVSVNQIIWGGNYFAHLLPASQGWLVWWKKDGLPRGTFADCELAWTSFARPAQVYNSRWHGFIRDSREDRVAHPTQKAEDVMRWCIEQFSKPGDTILDPFMGSGTTGVACKNLGRNFIGIELDPEYFRIAKERVEAATPSLESAA